MPGHRLQQEPGGPGPPLLRLDECSWNVLRASGPVPQVRRMLGPVSGAREKSSPGGKNLVDGCPDRL